MKQKKNHRTIYDTMREILECVENGIHPQLEIGNQVGLNKQSLRLYVTRLSQFDVVTKRLQRHNKTAQCFVYIIDNNWREKVDWLESKGVILDGVNSALKENYIDVRLPFEKVPVQHNVQGRVISERHSTRTRFKAEWRGIGSSFNIV